MLDVLIRGGEVVDGTGAPRVRADLGIRDGRIVCIGTADESARRTIDAEGLVVAPGFVDIHTHYDAQLLWDPTASPSPLHGVTTVLGGNCGFSIAPMAPDETDYLRRLMARVEGMPLDALEAVDWDWRSFGDYLDRLEGRVALNAGFLVGHSTLRRLAMGAAAVGEPADERAVARMVALAHDSMAGGALGLSSSLGDAHTDGDGRPVPSRAASREEFLALAAAVRDHPGTALEFIPGMGEIRPERADLMAEMSLAANRPLNWNLLGSMSSVEIYEQQLTASDLAAERGARVIAMTLPDLLRTRVSRILEEVPEWREVLTLPAGRRRGRLAEPGVRDRLRAVIAELPSRGRMSALGRFDLIEVAEAVGPETEAFVGRTIADIARERGVAPADVLIDVVLPDALPLTLVLPSLAPSLGLSDEGWEVRAGVWRDDRTVLGGSDAGAHLDIMCHANYTTVVLGEAVRRRGLLSLEEAVRQFTTVPVGLYGLRERGCLAEGWHADVVVLDPATVDSFPARARTDLPGGGVRLFAEGTGIAHVFVNGVEVVSGDRLTGAAAGTVLRSGRDTDTVSVPGGAG